MRIFEYTDYKAYIRAFIKNRPANGRGFRTQMAEHIRCKTAFIAQVLNGDANFCMEHAESLNELFEHTLDEAEYFLFIVQYQRAGTQKLRDRLKVQIDRIINKRQILKERVDIKESLSIEVQATYYSHWYYSVIHLLLTIEKYQTPESIIMHTKLPRETVLNVLDFLVKSGLAIQKGNLYLPGTSRLFLGGDSPNITKHHMNWRLQSMLSLDRHLQTDLHFSGVFSLAAVDIIKAKEELIRGIDSTRSVVRNTQKEEEIYGICVDFFKM